MEKVRQIFLTVFIMILSMTIINGEETSQEPVEETIIEEDINAEDINEEDINVEDIDEEAAEAEESVEDEEADVSEVPELSGPPELSETYLMALEEATAEGHMPIDILIQNGYLKTDVDAFIYMDKTYVPLRSVVEAFGLTDVVWDADNYVASVTGHGYTMEFLLNKPEVIVNGQVQDLQTPTVLVDDRMMVPLSFISELLGFEVIWDQTYYTVGLIHPTLTVNPEYIDDRFYTYEELQNFAKLVMREAGHTSYEVHHGVASVVMNRMSHPSFGSSVDGVIFNTDWAVQFPPAHKANFDDTRPNEKAVKAVKYTLRGQNSVETCIFFNDNPFKSKTIYKVVDGMYFMKD